METLLQDIRYGARVLLKSRGFAAVAVLSLALGIGANTAIFSLVDKLLLRSLPVEAPDELVLLTSESVNPHFVNNIFSYPDYADYRDQNEVLSGLTAFIQMPEKLGSEDHPEQVLAEIVSGNYFDVLGVKTARGRAFLPEEDKTPGTHPVTVLSYGLWQRRFGADPEIIGKAVPINGLNYTVIGIAPQNFTGLNIESSTDLWVPVRMFPQLMPQTFSFDERRMAWLRVAGRLKPGVTIAQAEASLDTLARQIREGTLPASDLNLPFNERRMRVEPGGKGISFLRPKLGPPLTLLMGFVGLILLIACANVANLLLARSTVRRKEIAVRLAIGASRGRLIRQMLTESALLAFAGGAAGLILAPWLSDLLIAYQSKVVSQHASLNNVVDGRVLGFTLLVSLLAGFIFGIVPALQSSRDDLVPALKDDAMMGGGRERFLSARHVLVIAQVALSLVVLIGAGLLTRSLRNFFAIDPGFNPENVMVAGIELPPDRYDKNRGREFIRELTERLKTTAGVRDVATADRVPLGGGLGKVFVKIEGYEAEPGENLGIDYNSVGPGYHELMGIPLIAGRGFTERDREGSPGVVVINEAFARQYFPNQNAIGKRISRGPGNPWLEIVGITRDLKFHSLTETPIPHLDLPALQMPFSPYQRVLVRTAGDASDFLPVIGREVSALDSGILLSNTTTLSGELSNSIATERMAAMLSGLFGFVALLIAAIGLYGVIAYAVNRRTREIGIRLALGAKTSDVLSLIIRQAVMLVLAGVAVGLVSAFALTRFMSSLLYGISTTDISTFAAVSGLLIAVGLAACYIPARRAARVDPMEALRYE